MEGLDEAEAADIDLPLVQCVEHLLDELFRAGFTLQAADYDGSGEPTGKTQVVAPGDNASDPLVVVLATRNQAVDDATDVVERLRDEHGLSEQDLLASTVDSWQGQTNGITAAIHPLSGAAQLDDFNSAFGRLAVTCTWATHGLLVVSRPGLTELLENAPARHALGRTRQPAAPRQTHKRILSTFARGTVRVSD